MNKKQLSERDICTKFITPSLRLAGWDEITQLREEVSFTKGRIIVRGKLVTRGKAKRADYILLLPSRTSRSMALCDRLEAAQAERERRRDRLAAASLKRLNEPTNATESREHVRFHMHHLTRLTTRLEHIKGLRQTILNLAVRGRLVAQDRNDGYATEVDQSSISADATPFEIPQNWRWSRLKALGQLKGGGTPSKSRDDFWNGSIPWVSPKDMKRDYIEHAQMTITPEALAGSAATMIDAGSLLFVVRGMILAHSFPVAIARVRLSVNQDMKALTLGHPEYGEFLLRVLKGLREQMLCRVQLSSHGTCRIEGADYRNFLIPIPPLAEQHRIVAKVDELMSICDKLESQISNVGTESRRLLEAALHQALAVA